MTQTRSLGSPNKSPLEKRWTFSQCPLSITILPHFLPVPSASLLQLRTHCQPFPLQLCKGDIATETTARLSFSSRPGLPPPSLLLAASPRCLVTDTQDRLWGPLLRRETHVRSTPSGGVFSCSVGHTTLWSQAAATHPACHFLDTLQPSEKPVSLPRCFCDQITPT